MGSCCSQPKTHSDTPKCAENSYPRAPGSQPNPNPGGPVTLPPRAGNDGIGADGMLVGYMIGSHMGYGGGLGGGMVGDSVIGPSEMTGVDVF